ncbi:MAG: hypothetical protein Kow0032_00810 [Methyloligellaceae bacterium]
MQTWLRLVMALLRAVVALWPAVRLALLRHDIRASLERDQLDKERKALRRALDARRRLSHDAERVRRDPRNRDRR